MIQFEATFQQRPFTKTKKNKLFKITSNYEEETSLEDEELLQNLNQTLKYLQNYQHCEELSQITKKTKPVKKQIKSNLKYKTEICKNFEVNGFCEFGQECCYAHGKDELKNQIFFKNNYKTKICQSFHKQGYCPYGSRCQFFHMNKNTLFQDILQIKMDKTSFKINIPKFSLRKYLKKGKQFTNRLETFQNICSQKTKQTLLEEFNGLYA